MAARKPIGMFTGWLLDSIFILRKLRPLFWRGLHYNNPLNPNKAQEEQGYPTCLPLKWVSQTPGFPSGIWTKLVGFAEATVEDAVDENGNTSASHTEVVDVWGGLDSEGTFARTYDRAYTWTDVTKRKAPWAVPWSLAFSIGEGRIVVPGVYNREYLLTEPDGWTKDTVIAGYCPVTTNPLFQTPIQYFSDVVSTVYLGNNIVMYSDCINVAIDSRLRWYFTNNTSLMPGWTNSMVDPPGEVYEFDLSNTTSRSRGFSYTFTGPAPAYNTEMGIYSKDTSTNIIDAIACTDMARTHEERGPYTIHQYDASIYQIPDVDEFYYDAHTFQVYTVYGGRFDSHIQLRERMMEAADDAKDLYVSQGGFLNPTGIQTPLHGNGVRDLGVYPSHRGPMAHMFINLTVWGDVSSGKVIPIRAKISGWAMSETYCGDHFYGSSDGPSSSKDKYSRRGIIAYPKYYLGNKTILGLIRMMDIPAGDTTGTIHEPVTPFGVNNTASRPSSSLPGGHIEPGAPNLRAVPYASSFGKETTTTGDISSGTGHYYDDWSLSLDNGETWGPPLMIKAGRVSDSVQFQTAKVVVMGAGLAIVLIEGKFYRIEKDPNINSATRTDLVEIELKEEATWINTDEHGTKTTKSYEITDLISCMRSPDQFMFEISGPKGYSLVIAYGTNFEHMKLLDGQDDDEAGLFTTPRPYFVPTFAGKGLDSIKEDKAYPFPDKDPDPLAFSTTSMENTILGYEYYKVISMTGGVPPFTFSKDSGDIPPGLTLDSGQGNLSGKTTKAGEYTFILKVVGSLKVSDDTPDQTISSDPKNSAKQQFTISVTEATVETLEVILKDGEPIEDAKVGHAYSLRFAGKGGTPPYTYSAVAIPAWDFIVLNTKTGVLTGSPTEASTPLITIGITDSSDPVQTASRKFMVSVKVEG
jgi:hypothetical protein